jgi:hypothetical protein
MDKFLQFLNTSLDRLSHVRIDALVLYFFGITYYIYLHFKHDKEIVRGLKGDNQSWEAPEVVIYFWIQSFPFILFGDAFLGLHLSDGMMVVFTLILLFAIMGRAGVELVLAWKAKITGGVANLFKEPEQKNQ